MAEAFGLAASCLSILQLTLECYSKLHEFCRDMGDAAKELEGIIADLKGLSASMDILYQLTSLNSLPPEMGPASAKYALTILHQEIRRCKNIVLELSSIISDLKAEKSSYSTTRKRIYAFKFALRKGTIKELQDKVEQAKTSMLLAKSNYDRYVKFIVKTLIHKVNRFIRSVLLTNMAFYLHRFGQKFTSNTPAATNISALESQIRRSVGSDTALLSPCDKRRCQCQCHAVAIRSGRFWSTKFPSIATLWGSCNRADCENRQHFFSFRVSLTPLGIKRAAIFVTSLSLEPKRFFISPSLSTDRTVDFTAPGFVLLWKYQTRQIHFKAFRKYIVQSIQSGNSHINDVDPAGRGWLEVSRVFTSKAFNRIGLNPLENS